MITRVEFEPRDLWVGAYWKRYPAPGSASMHSRWQYELYLCFIPMLPVHVSWFR